MRTIAVLGALALFVAPVVGQAQKQLTWDMPGSTLAQVQGFTYSLSIDAGAATTVVPVCSGAASPFVCKVPLPALTAGPTHTAVVWATEPINGLEGARSTPFQISIPGLPGNVRVQ